ncbi:E3 ubiquitin-protein ligase rnf213-alpha-like, partial [Saccoglossus kowalevskii]
VEVNGLIQVMGSLITPPRHLKYKDMEYKYVVLKKGAYNWEFIPDDSPYKNRWMKIQRDYYVPGGIWNRYDDVIYPKPDMWNKIRSTLWDKFRKQALKNKILVTKKMLPTLEEFCIGKKNNNLAMDTIQQVKQIFRSVDENWNPGFDSKKFMLEYLEPVFKSYRTTKVTDGRLVSALAVLYLLRHLDMMHQLKYCQVGDLFEGLLIQPDLEKKTIPSIDEMHQHFPQKEDKSYLVAAMEHFCNHTFQDADSLDPRFLLCTPVLHFLRENSVPFKPVSDEGDPLQMSWWGASQLKLQDFRDRVKNKYEMLPLVRRLAPIFEADQMLLRTCLLSIPLNEINSVVKSGLIPTYAVCYRLVVFVASLAKYDISSIWRE